MDQDGPGSLTDDVSLLRRAPLSLAMRNCTLAQTEPSPVVSEASRQAKKLSTAPHIPSLQLHLVSWPAARLTMARGARETASCWLTRSRLRFGGKRTDRGRESAIWLAPVGWETSGASARPSDLACPPIGVELAAGRFCPCSASRRKDEQHLRPGIDHVEKTGCWDGPWSRR